MTTFFDHLARSPEAQLWHRFYVSLEEAERLYGVACALGMSTQVVPSAGVPPLQRREMFDGAHACCVLEPVPVPQSPFVLPQQAVLAAYTEDAGAVRAQSLLGGVPLPAANGASGTNSLLAHLLRDSERLQWERAENSILKAMQSLERMDFEGEEFFRRISALIRSVLSPVYFEFQPDTPADYWSKRSGDWTWREPEDIHAGLPTVLSPAAQRLLYRKERILQLDEPASATELLTGDGDLLRLFRTALVMPLQCSSLRLGFLRLFYRCRIVPLPLEWQMLEAFQRAFATLLHHHRLFLHTQHMAVADGLTNLFNHRFFHEQLRTEFRRATRYPKMMSVIMIDIDDFKSFNDTYGHLAGDRVLSEVAKTIRSMVRDIDFVARYGGEEFALILPEVDASSGMVVAEKIRKAVEEQRFTLEDGEPIGSITISCGVSDNQGATSPEDLIERADRALYWVKRNGRNLVRLAEAADEV